jgi:hypothetical protein
MSDVCFGSMYEKMLEAAAANGPRGIAFCMPIEPQEVTEGVYATLFMFHTTTGAYADQFDPRVLSVYAGLSAEQQARKSGNQPRATAWP